MNDARSAVERVKRDRPSMPTLAEIAAAWAEVDHDELRRLFPDLRAHVIGWGEPFCFRCGWLAPGREFADYSKDWKRERVWDLLWNGKSGWLERGHLHDHQHGGGSDPLDLVPMCPLCHEQQPQCRRREEGVAFVNEEAPHAAMVPLAQIFTDHCYRERRRPGKQMALRCLLRAHAAAGSAVARAQAQREAA